MLCADCDQLAITSSVHAANCLVLTSHTGEQCVEQQQDKQHVLIDAPVNPGLAGWSTVSPVSPYSCSACSMPSRHVTMSGNM